MQFTPYLSFQGQAAQAFALYAEVFGGAVEAMRFADMPPDTGAPPIPPEQQGWVMHAALTLPDGGMLMGADMPPQFGGTPMTPGGMAVAVSLPSSAEARAAFDRLAAGGRTTMPFGPTFFSAGFGMCVDRFGTPWMVMAADGAA